MHRGELLQVLVDVVDPGRIHPGKRLNRIEHTNDGVTATFSDGSTATADVLIGADGIASTIREEIFAGTTPQYAGYSTWRGVVSGFDPGPQWPAHAIVRTLGCGEHFGIGALGEGRYLCTAPRTDPTHRRTGDDLMRVVASWAPPVPDIVDATPEDEILLHPVYKLRPLKTWHSGRVVLVGDAAHPIEPALGMGAALALEDAVELASALSSSGSYADPFRAFEQKRARRVRRPHTLVEHSRPQRASGEIGRAHV